MVCSSVLLDRANRTFLCIASVAGGMEIEQVAEEQPERVAKIAIDINEGVDEAKAREIVAAGSFPDEVADQVADIAVKLWQACGFRIVGTLPGAFMHPDRGAVDAYVMFREL